MSKVHPDGMTIKFTRGQLLVSRVQQWAVIDKYFDEELGAWVTRYKPAWASQDGFKDPL